MIYALGNVGLILAALALFFLADAGTFFWFLEPTHSTYAFLGLLVLLFAAAEWLNAQRWDSPMRLMTSWGTSVVALAILGLQTFNSVDLSALTAPSADQGQQSASVQPQKRASQGSETLDQATTYGEVEIRAARNGNFYTDASINGTGMKVLVDTGASFIALTYKDAEALSLDPLNLDYSMKIHTANGVSSAAPVELDEVTVAGITVNNVQAIVSRPGALGITLLGMSYLSRAGGFKIAGDRLILGE